jgi:4-aminobutyrate aminotransferase
MQNTEHLSPVWTHLTQIQPVKGKGAYLYDEQGNQYLDFTSGIGVTNTGHCHPKVVKAIKEQAENLLFGQMNIVIAPVVARLAEKLDKITPPEINRFFFANSGAEATEGVVKLAKAATGRSNIIVFQGSFHGRTHLAMAMTTSKTVYRHKFQPMPAGIFVAPFPYAYYYGWSEDKTVDFCIKQLNHLLLSQTAPDETAAIIIEPVLGEGGYVPAPARFLQELRKICDQHGIILILDEIQSGFGRTGKFWCFEHAGITPDVIVMAKGLGSGLPISAIGAKAHLMEKWKPGTHGGTYGGGSCIPAAAACASVDVVSDENLPENARLRGEQLQKALKKLQKEFKCIGDVRGMGLMIATEFVKPDGSPDSETPTKVMKYCHEHRLLIMMCGTYGNIMRWIPPLIVSKKQIDDAVVIFANALRIVS